jgi:FMN hydrolase / 5-amino-6-(5-phospho-D-ribitylamino)uracil phosphatase
VTARRPVAAVAFDVMDTLVHDPFRGALEAATGMPADEVFARRDPETYPAFERGEIDEAEFWARHRQRGIPVDVERFHALRRSETWLLPGITELLDELAGAVTRIAATNYPVWIDELAGGVLDGRVDHVVASCRIGVRKPDPAFYDRVVEVAGVPASGVRLVDDRHRNVDGARAVGIRSHRFAGVAGLRAWLAAEGVDVRNE